MNLGQMIIIHISLKKEMYVQEGIHVRWNRVGPSLWYLWLVDIYHERGTCEHWGRAVISLAHIYLPQFWKTSIGQHSVFSCSGAPQDDVNSFH